VNLFKPNTPPPPHDEALAAPTARNDRCEYIDGLAGFALHDALERARKGYYQKWDAHDDWKSNRRCVIMIGWFTGIPLGAMLVTRVWQVSFVALAMIILSFVLYRVWHVDGDTGARLEAELDAAEEHYFYLERHPWELGEEAA
jgi:hypothetical protein